MGDFRHSGIRDGSKTVTALGGRLGRHYNVRACFEGSRNGHPCGSYDVSHKLGDGVAHLGEHSGNRFKSHKIGTGANVFQIPSTNPEHGVDSISQMPENAPPTSPGSTSNATRSVRGQNRSLNLFKMKEKNGKPRPHFISTGEVVNACHQLFSREMSRLVKLCAPVDVTGWASIPEEVKYEIYKRMAEAFDIDIDDHLTKKSLRFYGQKGYKSWRFNCHKHYKSCGGGETARANPPEEFQGLTRVGDWNKLCDLFDSEKFQRKSVVGASNRGELKDVHHNGSTSFQYYAHKQDKQAVDCYPHFYTTKESNHTKFTSERTQEVADKIVEYREQCTQNGRDPTQEEILLYVVGPSKRNNVPGMGSGTKILKRRRCSQYYGDMDEITAECASLKDRLVQKDIECETLLQRVKELEQHKQASDVKVKELQQYNEACDRRFDQIKIDMEQFRLFMSENGRFSIHSDSETQI